jgi:hypothetical protein
VVSGGIGRDDSDTGWRFDSGTAMNVLTRGVGLKVEFSWKLNVERLQTSETTEPNHCDYI